VEALDLTAIVDARTTEGGTGHEAVAVQLARALQATDADERAI